MAYFSEQQLAEIGAHFGLKPDPRQSLPVRDGKVFKGDRVWWRSVDGPELVDATADWANILAHPDLYQLERPKTSYVD